MGRTSTRGGEKLSGDLEGVLAFWYLWTVVYINMDNPLLPRFVDPPRTRRTSMSPSKTSKKVRLFIPSANVRVVRDLVGGPRPKCSAPAADEDRRQVISFPPGFHDLFNFRPDQPPDCGNEGLHLRQRHGIPDVNEERPHRGGDLFS